MSHTRSFFSIAEEYIQRMLPAADPAPKVLLLDDSTLSMISTALTQTALLQTGVFLVENVLLYRPRKYLKKMRCIVYIRPTKESVDAVCKELQNPKYGSYAFYFSNTVSSNLLDDIARADTKNLVNHVEEFFCDFMAVNNDTALVAWRKRRLGNYGIGGGQIPSVLAGCGGQKALSGQTERGSLETAGPAMYAHIAQGLASLCVAMRCKPFLRFQRGSSFAERVVHELMLLFKNDPELFDYPDNGVVMLIIDRNDDPVTPLLVPWTYQAMLHEHIGLDGNRLTLPQEGQQTKGGEHEFVFSEHDDPFFAANMMKNWGDLCVHVKSYIDNCKESLHMDRSTVSMQEIRDFIQKIPQTKSFTSSVTKHASVVTFMSTLLRERQLLDVSLLEQDMVTTLNPNDHYKRLLAFAQGGKISRNDLLRLCALYSFRYEKQGTPSRVTEFVGHHSQKEIISKLREYYGVQRPVDELFKAGSIMSAIVKTFSDEGNVFTQHEPRMKKHMTDLCTGKLDMKSYPFVSGIPKQRTFFPEEAPSEVMMVCCGGICLAEAALAHAVNHRSTQLVPNAPTSVRMKLVGTAILNTSEFLNYVLDARQ